MEFSLCCIFSEEHANQTVRNLWRSEANLPLTAHKTPLKLKNEG